MKPNFSLHQTVFVRDLSAWVRGTIVAIDWNSIAVLCGGRTIHIHESVYWRDVRVAHAPRPAAVGEDIEVPLAARRMWA